MYFGIAFFILYFTNFKNSTTFDEILKVLWLYTRQQVCLIFFFRGSVLIVFFAKKT